MNSEDPAMLEQRIDTGLAQLPEWQPTPDFARRLAAAAVRQGTPAHAITPRPSWKDIVPTALGSAALAATLAWIVPWSQLSENVLVWTCVACMSSSGVFTTLRVLRRP